MSPDNVNNNICARTNNLCYTTICALPKITERQGDRKTEGRKRPNANLIFALVGTNEIVRQKNKNSIAARRAHGIIPSVLCILLHRPNIYFVGEEVWDRTKPHHKNLKTFCD